MSRLCDLLQSSLGKKLMVASAGLLLCGFLVTHLAGNLLMLKSGEAFNHYAAALEANPLLPIAEIGLFALFVLHIVVALALKVQNRRARPVAYSTSKSKGGRTWGSATMAFTGLLILSFLVVHIKTFKFGDQGDGLYSLVMHWFGNPAYSAFYVLAMLGLGLHLSHGFWGAFQTFGVDHPEYTPWIKRAGWAFAALVAGGFAFLPIWAYGHQPKLSVRITQAPPPGPTGGAR